jgi:hypothetical protein
MVTDPERTLGGGKLRDLQIFRPTLSRLTSTACAESAENGSMAWSSVFYVVE